MKGALDLAAAVRLPTADVLQRLGSSLQGLSSATVHARLAEYGQNIVAKKRSTAVLDFLGHFRNPLIIILLIAAAISGFIGETVNMVIILTIVLLSVVLDFTQERKAERATALLQQKI